MAAVLTIGTFDLFHSGHVDLLRRCKRLVGHAGKVIVGLNTDEFVKEYKGQPPAVPYKHRALVLRGTAFVDDIFSNLQEDGTIQTLLDEVQNVYDVNVLAVGEDWAKRNYGAQIGVDPLELLALYDISLVYLPRPLGGISTTQIKESVIQQYQKSQGIGRTRVDWGD